MKLMKMLSLMVLISTCLHAHTLPTFKIHKPYQSVEAAQTLVKGIERIDISMIVAALKNSDCQAITIGTLDDTPLMFAVRKYLKSLVDQEKTALIEHIFKDKEQQRLHAEKQNALLARSILKSSFVGLFSYHGNQRTILAKSFIISALAGFGSGYAARPDWNKNIHHHFISALIGFSITLLVETLTQDELADLGINFSVKHIIKTSLEKQREIIELLIKASHDISMRNNEGINVIDLIVAYKQSALPNSQEVNSLLNSIMTKYSKHALLEHPLDDIMEQFMNHTRR